MNKKIARLAIPTAAAVVLIAAGSTMTVNATAEPESTPGPVKVEAMHEESGELSEVTVTTEDGEYVEVLETDESWRGNDEAEDGLYAEDPAAEEQEEVADNVDQEALEDAPETTETDDETVSAEDDSEAVTDDEEDAWAPDPDAINVYVEVGSNGEVTAVELTDAEGNDVPVGSIAESHGDDNNTDEEN